MNTIFHINHGDDLYEISMRENTIVRISRYNANSRRVDVEFDHLTHDVQVKIIDKAKHMLSH